MKPGLWLAMLTLVVAACGGAQTADPAATTSLAAPTPGSDRSGAMLSGLSFEVHQEPG